MLLKSMSGCRGVGCRVWGVGMSGDFWADMATPVAAPETAPKPPRQTRAGARQPAVPFADAWLVFRLGDDGGVEDLRVATGSHLNRLPKGEPRDWTNDIQLAAFGPTPKDAWREFCAVWAIEPQHRPAALREVARVEGLDWLALAAERYAAAMGLEGAA